MKSFALPTAGRTCSATGLPLQPGELVVSAVIEAAEGLSRRDFSEEHWAKHAIEIKADCVGWWQHQVPAAPDAKVETPREILLGVFRRWLADPRYADHAFLFALYLVRRKVLRFDDHSSGEPSINTSAMKLFCATENRTYDVPTTSPSTERQAEIQAEFEQVLDGTGNGLVGPSNASGAA